MENIKQNLQIILLNFPSKFKVNPNNFDGIKAKISQHKNNINLMII